MHLRIGACVCMCACVYMYQLLYVCMYMYVCIYVCVCDVCVCNDRDKFFERLSAQAQRLVEKREKAVKEVHTRTHKHTSVYLFFIQTHTYFYA